MKKAVIIHGTKGSPQGSWFPDISAELVKSGYHAIVPQFPTPEGQNLSNWLHHFERSVGELDRQSIMIGHSVGAVFTLRVLERLNSPIAATVLVAGFTGVLGLPEYDELNSSFVADTYNWKKIRENARHILCISGDNDPYVPFPQSEEIADSLEVEHIVIAGGGHLNAEFGYTAFPRIIEELIKMGVSGKITTSSP